MYDFHTFLFYKMRNFTFTNHNQLKNYLEPQESSIGTQLSSPDLQLQESSLFDLQPHESPILPDLQPLSSMAAAAAPVVASTPQDWTYEDLITIVLKSNEETIYWLQDKHLLALSMDCSKCSSQCRLVRRKGTLYWRCPRKGCQAVVSVRDKNFFAKSKLSLQTILKLAQLWTRQTRETTAAHEVKVTECRNRLV